MNIGRLLKYDKVRALYTQKERTIIKSILNEFNVALPEIPESVDQYELVASPFFEKIDTIHEKVKQRYILGFLGDKAAILSDVQSILNVIEKEDFEKMIEIKQKSIPDEELLLYSYERIQDPLKKKNAIDNIPTFIKSRKDKATANYINCYKFLLSNLEEQIEALQYYSYPLSELEELVAAKCSEWYPEPETDIIPRISTSEVSDILYPLDKVNAVLWNCFSIGETTPLKAETDKDSRKGKQANIYVMLAFNELDGVKISRPLTSFDKRVFTAIANLRESGNETMTIKQIHEVIGNQSIPDKSTRNKIIESIETMSHAVVTIDTTEENKIYPHLDRIVWESPLLHIEKIKGYSRGQITNYAIRILETPKLYLFAKQRKQITSAPRKLFESPISKTEANLLLEDYIFTRIARMKNNTKIPRTMLLETIYQKCNITTKKQRQRLPEKIERYLKHYVSVEWIKAYKMTDKSIEIVT